MSDFLKSVFDAWDERIRSPILGSIALVYFAFYWKPLFVLFFSTDPAAERMAEFNQGLEPWSWVAALPFVEKWIWPVMPLLLGIVLALLSPWIKFVGAWIARWANKRLSELQEDDASERKIRNFRNLERELEAKKDLDVAEAKRKKELIRLELETQEQLEKADVSSDFKAGLVEKDRTHLSIQNELSDIEKSVLIRMARIENDGFDIFSKGDVFANVFRVVLEELIPDVPQARIVAEVTSAIRKFDTMNLATSNGQGIFTLTSKGYLIADELTLAR